MLAPNKDIAQVKPPASTMPGVWDEPDADGFPMRHEPVRLIWRDRWRAKCGETCWHFRSEQTVIDTCLPCLGCYGTSPVPR